MPWKALRQCWALPHADAATRAVLLDRQLRNLFRVIPWYVASNLLTALGVFQVMAPFLQGRRWQPWAMVFVVVHVGWAVHAIGRWRVARGPHPQELRLVDLWVSAGWCGLAAMACGIGLYLGAPLAASDGSRLLLAAYTPGLIATGVLVGITAPLVSFLWLVILTVAACLMVARLDFLAQGMTITQLCCYAVMLTIALLFVSRMLVKRIEAETSAARQKQIVGLLLREFESNANDWLWESDCRGSLSRVGPSLARMLGRDDAALLGKRLDTLFSRQRLIEVASDREVGVDALQRRLSTPVPFTGLVVEAATPETFSWKISARPLHAPSGAWIGWRGVGCDVSDARLREAESLRRERHLHALAHHDALTGLPNRRRFMEASPAEACARDRVAVALIDLDNFKAINDGLGHATGDQILCRVAERLRRAIAPGDVLARLGGDEFALMVCGLPEQETEADLRQRLVRIQEGLREPEMLNGYRIDVRASIGTTLVDAVPAEIGELLRQADIALYAAKADGRDTLAFYEPGMGERIQARLAQVSDLYDAVGQGHLELHYMAQYGVHDLQVQAYEALVRWHHPVYGQISPADFIPMAETSGVIVPLGLWVLERACRDALAWPQPVTVAVNVSPAQLEAPGLVASFLEVLHRTGLPPQRLELEITESVLARDPKLARGVLQQLREAGIRIAMDDFGVGYSSMAQLSELPFDRIKLDQSFAAALRQPGARDMTVSIIRSIVQIARGSQIQVTAEGVETPEQLQDLRDLGCDAVQGFLLGRPVPAAWVGRPGAERALRRRRR